MNRYTIVLFLVLGWVAILAGQDKNFEETLRELSKDAGKAYVAPIVSGFGANLNSGWFHRAPRATMFGFDLEFGAVAMGTFFKDEHKKFSTSGIFQFDSSEAAKMTDYIKTDPAFNPYNASQRDALQRAVINAIRGKDFQVGIAGATVIGSKSDTVRASFGGGSFTVTDPNTGLSRTVNVPSSVVALGVGGLTEPGSESRVFPLAAPQLTIGTFFGSQFTFRYIPTFKVEDFGEVKYFGFGVQHNPGVWFGDILPLELSASFFTQTLEASSVFKSTATAFGVTASKRLGWGFLNLTPYGGFMVESSKMTFSYDYFLDTPTGRQKQTVEFELDGENKTRITAGLSIKVLIVNINADYNWSKYNSASIGVMFII
jgi:hypothetical protein